MPNWCETDAWITGPNPQKILDFMKSETEDFDFNNLIPYPSELAEADAAYLTAQQAWVALSAKERSKVEMPSLITYPDGFNHGGYEWCVANWGTKWNATDFRAVDLIGEELTFTFDTAWSPPEPIFKALSAKFPDYKMVFTYFEAGMGYNGRSEYADGELVSDASGAYFGDRGG